MRDDGTVPAAATASPGSVSDGSAPPAKAPFSFDEETGVNDNGEAGADPSRWRLVLTSRAGTNGMVLLGYLLVSLWLWRELIPHIGSETLNAGLFDPGLFIWWLRWAPFAVLHGHDPLYTYYLNAPSGASAIWNTSVLPLGLLFLPITEIFGVIATWNLLLILGPALSAWTCSIWLRRHSRLLPSVVGGLLFGFCPFVVLQAQGHLHLIWLCLVPVMAMLVEDILWRSPRPLWPAGPLLGVVAGVQLLISSEVLVMTAMAAVVATVGLVAFHPSAVAARLKPAALSVGSAVAVAGVLALGPLLSQFSPGHVIHGPVQPVDYYEAEPADLLYAPSSVVLHTSHSAAEADRLFPYENGLYVGIPLLAAALITCALVGRRRKAVLLAASTGVIFFVLSLGGRFRRVPGLGHHGPLLPWGYLEAHVRLLKNVLPVRLELIIWLALSLIIAIGLDELLARLKGWHTALVGLAAAACLVPLVPNAEPAGIPVAATPYFFTSSEIHEIPQGSIALLAPLPNSNDTSAMLWQVESGMRFAEIGGYVIHPVGPRRTSSLAAGPPALAELLSVNVNNTVFHGPVPASLRTEARAELRQSGARNVIVGGSSNYAELVSTVEQLLGRPADQAEGGVAIWHLDPSS